MTTQAQILVQETTLPFGRRHRSYEWQGSRFATAEVSFGLYVPLKKEAPWPLKVVGDDFQNGRRIIARADGAAAFSWLYHSAVGWWSRTTGLTKSRLIITLMVWNLAYVPEGGMPDWCHVGKGRGRA